MPDADGFEPRLPGRADPAAPGVAHWNAALAALPQEAPEPGGWQRVRARLPAPAARRPRWPAWGALAASLALAVAIPLQHRPGPVDAAPAASGAEPAPRVAAAAPVAAPDATATESPAAAGPAAVDGAIASTASQARRPGSGRRAPARTPRSAPVEPAIRTLAPAAGTPMLADAGAEAEVQALQQQSAQLEGLLALARDERVSSGAASALSHELDAQVASIDAALIQPGLDPARRAALWGERVDALQQLAGIETTNRLYAARGQTYDVALVGVD